MRHSAAGCSFPGVTNDSRSEFWLFVLLLLTKYGAGTTIPYVSHGGEVPLCSCRRKPLALHMLECFKERERGRRALISGWKRGCALSGCTQPRLPAAF